MTQFVLTSRGSWGDTNPFLGLGVALQRRGHDVALVLNEVYRRTVTSLGLGFEPFASESAFQDELELNRDIRKGPSQKVRLERWHYPEAVATYAAIERLAARRTDTVVVARSWALAGRLAHDKLGLPLATVYLTPAEAPGPVLRVRQDRLREVALARALAQPWLPAPVARFGYTRLLSPLMDMVWDGVYDETVNDLRRQVGLAPASGLQTRYLDSPQLVIGLWPDWFYPPRRHWPAAMQTSGFVLHETRADQSVPDDVAAFIADGEPPIVFTAGTYRSGGAEAFFETSVEACRLLRRKGIFLNEHLAQGSHGLPDFILAKKYLPLHVLFQRAAAVVHHGGIGTVARAFEAALPQLIVPDFSDQPLNGERVTALGAGESIPPFAYAPERVTASLARLVASTSVRNACADLSHRVRTAEPLEPVCDALESLASSTRRSTRLRA